MDKYQPLKTCLHEEKTQIEKGQHFKGGRRSLEKNHIYFGMFCTENLRSRFLHKRKGERSCIWEGEFQWWNYF